MSNSCVGCVVDADAMRRFACVARQAFRELDDAAGATLGTVGLLAELVPHSAVAHAWCESVCAAATLVQRNADRFGRLAEHTDLAVGAYLESDRAHGRLFAGLEVRI